MPVEEEHGVRQPGVVVDDELQVDSALLSVRRRVEWAVRRPLCCFACAAQCVSQEGVCELVLELGPGQAGHKARQSRERGAGK